MLSVACYGEPERQEIIIHIIDTYRRGGLNISFYGVRGSIPSPGPNTIKYGGNTSCVHIALDDHREIVFDAGTGLRILGHKLESETSPVNIILSHSHWDHIQGYPFFSPIYQTDRDITVFNSNESEHKLLCTLFDQMDGSSFPVKAEKLPSQSVCVFRGVESMLARKQIMIEKKALNHHGGGFAYKVSENDMTVAYVTDNELDPPGRMNTTYSEWVDFLHGVDVLIHDAQYTEDDMPHKHGWGHSLISQVRQLAVDAEVGALVMFHHDPERTDNELDEIQIENERHLRLQRTLIKSICAFEGMQIRLNKALIGGDVGIDVGGIPGF